METYSIYNLKADNNMSFATGPVSGSVLAINADGSTTWSNVNMGQTGSTGVKGATGSATASNIIMSPTVITAPQSLSAVAIYITGSKIADLGPGSSYIWRFYLSKTQGSATPIFQLKYGSAGTTSDTTVLTFTLAAGTTPVTDTMFVEINVNSLTTTTQVASISAEHNLSITGWANVSTPQIQSAAGSTTTNVAGSFWGIAFTGGASIAGAVRTWNAIGMAK